MLRRRPLTYALAEILELPGGGPKSPLFSEAERDGAFREVMGNCLSRENTVSINDTLPRGGGGKAGLGEAILITEKPWRAGPGFQRVIPTLGQS